MHRVLAIATMSFRRLYRTRLLAVALVVAGLVPGAYSTILIVMFTAAKAGKMHQVESIFPEFFGVMVGLFEMVAAVLGAIIGMTLVRRDMNDGTIYSVLSKPITRGEYVAGNALGGFAMLAVVWMIFALVMATISGAVGLPLGGTHFAIMGCRLLLSSVSLAAALMFATRFNPWGAVALTLLLVNGIGIVETGAKILGLLHLDVPELLIRVACFPFPVMNALNDLTTRVTRSSIQSASILPGLIHIVDYVAVLLVLGYLFFRRLELNRTSD